MEHVKPIIRKARPNRRTVRAAIRGSVPDGKLRRAKIVLAEQAQIAGSPIGGFTEYDPKNRKDVVKLGAPLNDDAEGITIRGHETRHATRHTPTRKKPVSELEALCGQIVDDVNVESGELPNMAGITAYKRAHLTTAMKGLRVIVNMARKVKRGEAADSVALRNGQTIHAVRVLSMLKHYSSAAQGDYSLLPVKDRAVSKLRDAIGHRMLNAVSGIINQAISRRKRAKAISMLLALMEKEPDIERETEEEREGEEGDYLAPVQDGDVLDGKMDIMDLLPKGVYCARERSVSMRKTPDGVIINPARYVSAVVSNDANGLFSRRVKQKQGGCVVIDASGSMGVSRKNLGALCKLCPTAVVGYYSGHDTGKGTLCVYAAKGKRYDGQCKNIYGGNCVDLPAVRWLMKHPKPWVLVSDLKFCGGVLGSETIAHALVERAVKRGDLKVYRSLDEAYEAFGGKGSLRN